MGEASLNKGQWEVCTDEDHNEMVFVSITHCCFIRGEASKHHLHGRQRTSSSRPSCPITFVHDFCRPMNSIKAISWDQLARKALKWAHSGLARPLRPGSVPDQGILNFQIRVG